MLQPCPCLGIVREGNMRARRFAVIADHYGRFIVQSISTLHCVMVHQAALVVVAINRIQRSAHMLRGNQWPQSRDVGEILSQELIDEASLANLILWLFRILASHAAAQ